MRWKNLQGLFLLDSMKKTELPAFYEGFKKHVLQTEGNRDDRCREKDLILTETSGHLTPRDKNIIHLRSERSDFHAHQKVGSGSGKQPKPPAVEERVALSCEQQRNLRCDPLCVLHWRTSLCSSFRRSSRRKKSCEEKTGTTCWAQTGSVQTFSVF